MKPTVVALLFCGLCSALVAVFVFSASSDLESSAHDSLVLKRNEPIFLTVNVPAIGPLPGGLNDRELEVLIAPTRDGLSRFSASQCLHMLSAYGLDAQFQSDLFPTGRDLLRVLTDSDIAALYFSRPVMLSTPHGVRCVSGDNFGKASQAHRDQVFCCLAQLGLPFDFPIVVQGRKCEFRDVFRDSIANFHLEQREIEFTSIAYALYLPPTQAWRNKFGEEYTFDQLTVELLERKLAESHCCGTHLVEALVFIDRVDSEFAEILSQKIRDRLRSRLDIVVDSILHTQATDGSWQPDWHRDLVVLGKSSLTPASDFSARLLATSHITQLLTHLSPSRYVIDDAIFRKAISWLKQAAATWDQDFVYRNFCPCSHAAGCLRQFRNAHGLPLGKNAHAFGQRG